MELKNSDPLYILEEIAEILRSENGCFWDKEQTSSTLKPYLIEEAYEVYDAIEKDDNNELKEELGDLLYQVYAHAQIAKEKNLFNINDVAQSIIDKLIRRHPHVFGDDKVNNAEEVIEKWEIIKKDEKPERKSILEGVPRHLPSLLKAYRVQQKVSRAGFDWDNVHGAVLKIDEEINELKEAVLEGNEKKIEEESGDLLFSIVNVLRFMKVNADEALNRAVNKFIKRFMFIEKKVEESGGSIDNMSLSELEALWEKAKEEA